MPNAGEIEEIQEPWVKLGIVTPSTYIGTLMELAKNRRGTFLEMEYLDPQRVLLNFELPLGEVIVDFYDQLKTRTQGYASMDFEEIGYRAGRTWSRWTSWSPASRSTRCRSSSIAIGPRRSAGSSSTGCGVSSRARCSRSPSRPPSAPTSSPGRSVAAMRKNVLAKCYGGDITRKRKLLEKQKEGKQRMKRVGSVEIPQEAFLAVLRMDEV